MAQVVIDANIIISSAFGGIPLETTVKATGAHQGYLSVEIEAELRGVFSRLSKKLTEERQAFVGKKITELIWNGITGQRNKTHCFIKRCKRRSLSVAL
jgi:hypothetical protein